MTEEHKGLPVAGYLPQSDEKVQLVNFNKELEERCLRRIDWFLNENKKAWEEFRVIHYPDNTVKFSTRNPEFKPPYDPRMLALARTAIEDAWMWANRAVFQPARVSLPEDSITPNATTIAAMEQARSGVGMKKVASVDELSKETDLDDDIQDAFMWANRAVFQPARVVLPEDNGVDNENSLVEMLDKYTKSNPQTTVQECLDYLKSKRQNEV